MRTIVVALAVVVIGIVAHAQTLTDEKILAAIRAGEAKKIDPLVSDCVAHTGFGESLGASLSGGMQSDGGYRVMVSGNQGRIAFMAMEAKRLYKKFTLDSVTEEMRQPAFVVQVEPMKPSSSGQKISVAAPIDHIVLKSKVKPDATVQPETVEREPVEWSNLLGGKVEANRAVATFDLGSVKELPAGDFDVVVISTAGERRCKVGAKDRQKLLTQ
jgi:hypothetical protein